MNVTEIFLSNLLPAIAILISLCTLVGGVFAVRQGYAKTVTEVQERVITALKSEISTLQTQIETCDKETVRIKRVLATVRYALKRRGLIININGDFITLYDVVSRHSHVTRMRTAAQQGMEDAEAKVASLNGDEEEDADEDEPPPDTSKEDADAQKK